MKIIIILVLLIPYSIFSKGIYDGTKDAPVNFHVYDQSTGLPIEDVEIIIELLSGKNLMLRLAAV